MAEHGLTFKQAVNEAIRSGLTPVRKRPRRYTSPRVLGPARVDLTQALRIASDLEDDALSRRLAEGR